MRGYGTFEVTIGVPKSYDGHRCEYAREQVASKYGAGLVNAWIIQKTVPTEPVGETDPDKQYYVFGGNVRTD